MTIGFPQKVCEIFFERFAPRFAPFRDMHKCDKLIAAIYSKIFEPSVLDKS